MTRTRAALVVLDVVAALSSVIGGLAVTVGWIQFPAAWLEGSPFSGYTIPGLILCVAVGGSALAAVVATLRGARPGAAVSALAGLVMMGWIAGEVVILGPHGAYTWLQPAYFALGLAMTSLAVPAGRVSARSPG